MKYILLFMTAILLFGCPMEKFPPSFKLSHTIINRTSNQLAISIDAYILNNLTSDTTYRYNMSGYLEPNENQYFAFGCQSDEVLIPEQQYPVIRPSQDTCYNLTDTSSYILITDFATSALTLVNHEINSSSAGVFTYPNGRKVPICYYNVGDGDISSRNDIETIIIDDEFVKAFMKKDYTMLETFKDYYK